MLITKSSGEKEPLNLEKVNSTCRRGGASPVLCAKVVQEVQARAYEGMPSKEIYRLVIDLLKKEQPAAAARYLLRDAIFRLGPLGFEFEIYIAKILAAYGFKTELPPILQGACVSHEVDVLAIKDSRTAMIECKFRHDTQIFVGIKDTMATWARFLDLVEGSQTGKCPHADECWLVTNARFSHESIQYGHCKNMVMLSWNHPKERPLPAWIDDKGLYPITTLAHLPPEIHKKLIDGGVILLQDLALCTPQDLSQKVALPVSTLEKYIKEASMILQNTIPLP